LSVLAVDLRVGSAVTVVQLPYWHPLAAALREDHGWKIVYDCMDEWEDFPNIGRELLEDERRLVLSADLVTVTASLLLDKWLPVARRCLLVRNGVDYEFFARRCVPNALLDGVGHPIVGYYGALAEWIDFELIAACARARPDWTFVLIGDVFVKDLGGLDALPNVRLLGRRPYEEMPQFLYHFDVCLVPFRLNDMTHAVDPVKFYEYVSAGKPVVSVPLKEMAIYDDFAYFAEGPEAFVRGIASGLGERDPERWNRRMALARDNDWEHRHRAVTAEIAALHKLVSIVVVTFGNARLTRLCVESIYASTTWPRFELIIVDNASTDETRTYLRYLARDRECITIILNDTNRGFAAANNQGVAAASGDYVVLLNNDTVVPRGWLEPLLAALDDPEVGLVGPVTNAVGNEAKIAVDYASMDQMAEFASRWMAEHRHECFDIAMLAMFCVVLRRDVLSRIGPLDESYGIGMFEDDDYSRRIQAAGLRTVCVRGAFIHHFGQAAFRKLIETGEYDALWKRNQAIYESKWGQWAPKAPQPAKTPDGAVAP
jgi:GT2 family glycosyltransferase